MLIYFSVVKVVFWLMNVVNYKQVFVVGCVAGYVEEKQTSNSSVKYVFG